MKHFSKIVSSFILFVLLLTTNLSAQNEYPNWAYQMKVWPFDVLYPFNTGFAQINGEAKTSDEEIRNRLTAAKNAGANVVIFYIDNEQSYETFVDESGFSKTLARIQFLVAEAHNRDLKLICYLNGLEAVTVGATTDLSLSSLARNYPEWIQTDILGDKMVWYTTEEVEWIPENSEDAWVSPLSPWRDLFKQRLIALATTGLDGVYIDATFLPGVDSFGIKWASSDSYFHDEFEDAYGLPIPTAVNWNSESWRKFIYFRHEVIRDYLGELADVARANGMTPFFESSSCDFKVGTYLANDVPFTISGDIACSPEIEPEGDYRSAFRMSKSTCDANQDFPMWFLGWPESADKARREFSITLCHSGNYYPTADVEYPTNAFQFIDLLREPILDKRVPFQNTVLIYPMRSKDYSFETETAFAFYDGAFDELTKKHISFRILPLETMTADDLVGIENVILAGSESISDEEYNLLKNKTVVLSGENGTKNEWGTIRSVPLNFQNVAEMNSLSPNLPFSIQAPESAMIEFYYDETKSNKYFLFIYSNDKSGEIVLSNSVSMTAKVYLLGNNSEEISGTEITYLLNDYLLVVELQLSGFTGIVETNSLPEEMKLQSYPNPVSTKNKSGEMTIQYSLPDLELSNELTKTKIVVYDALGRKIATLVDVEQFHGDYEIKFDTAKLSSGLYFYRLEYGGKSIIKKMIIVR